MDVLYKILYILLAIVILLVMVVIHELGHYIAGRVLKFKINEFSVGFGPKVLQRKNKNDELITLRALPLGGYCAFEGDDDENVDVNAKSFNNEKPWKRIIVFFAGAFFNIISAFIFSFIFILAIGYAVPTVSTAYTDEQQKLYNELYEGDKIIAVNNKEINILHTFEELVDKFKLGDTAIFTVIRDGKETKVTVKKTVITTVDDSGKSSSYEGFGILTSRDYEKTGAGSALVYSVPYTLKLSWTILGTFGKLITGRLPLNNLSGPVGTVSQIASLSFENWRNILILLPLIASNLAVFNLLPIPALDGSKILFTGIEWIRKKPIKRSVENLIHFAGIIAIFGLVIIIDLIGFFT